MSDLDKLKQNPVEEAKRMLDLLKKVEDYQALAKYITINGKDGFQELDSNVKNYCNNTRERLTGNIHEGFINKQADYIIENRFLESVEKVSTRLEDYKKQIEKIDFDDEWFAEHLCENVLNTMKTVHGITVSVVENFVDKVR